MRQQVGSFEYAAALQRIWRDVVDSANRYIQETEPFKLAKTDLEACRAVLVNLADWLRVAAILIKPFLPRTAETFYRSFNFEEIKAWDRVSYGDATGPLSASELRVTATDHRRQARAVVSQDRAALRQHSFIAPAKDPRAPPLAGGPGSYGLCDPPA